MSRPTRAAAERALAALIRTLPGARVVARRTAQVPALPPATDGASLHACLVRWLDHKRRDVRPSTYRTYVQTLAPVLPHLGLRPLAGLTVLDIEDLVQALHRECGPRGAGVLQAEHCLALRALHRFSSHLAARSSSRSTRYR